MEHSTTLPPSSIGRIIKCPGSVQMAARVPKQQAGPHAAEGTAAHRLGDFCLQRGFDAEKFLGEAIDINQKAGRSFASKYKPDGRTIFAIDREMVEGVQLYVDTVRALIAEGYEMAFEQRLDMRDTAPNHFGTGDAVGYHEAKQRVAIVDLKYGKGVVVEVVNNEQELSYALGVARRFHNRGVREVLLIIVQPRAPHRDGPVRTWLTDVVSLIEHAGAVKKASRESQLADPPLNPGSWCKWCPGAPICPAYEKRILKLIGATVVNGEITKMSEPGDYAPEAFRRAFLQVGIVSNWVRAMQSFGHAEAMRGNMPGFKFVTGRGRRVWKDENTAVLTMQTLGVSDDDIYDTSLRSPAGVEKLVPKAVRAAIKNLAVNKGGKMVLVPDADPREAIDPNDANGFEPMEAE